MDPLTIGVLSASIIVGLAGASLAALKAWNGWLELKKMELTQIAGERGLPPATGPDRDGGPQGAGPQARGDRSRDRHLRLSPSALCSPGALQQRRFGSFRTASFYSSNEVRIGHGPAPPELHSLPSRRSASRAR